MICLYSYKFLFFKVEVCCNMFFIIIILFCSLSLYARTMLTSFILQLYVILFELLHSVLRIERIQYFHSLMKQNKNSMISVLEVKIFRLKGEKTAMLPSCIFQIECNYNIQIMAIYGWATIHSVIFHSFCFPHWFYFHS